MVNVKLVNSNETIIYTVFDSRGRLVLNGKVNSEGITIIDLVNLENGTYHFKFYYQESLLEVKSLVLTK